MSKPNGKLITGSIDVTKIDKSKLYKGEKGIYLNVAMWLNDEPDEFGNHMSIQQQQTKEERESKADKIYLGNGKIYESNGGESKPLTQEDKDDLPF